MGSTTNALPENYPGATKPFTDNPLPEEAYFQGDPGGVVRLTYNVLQDLGLAKPGAEATNAIGLTVVFAVGTGYMGFRRAENEYAKAKQLGDQEGMNIARTNMVRGIVEATGGLEFTPYRILGLSHHRAGSTLAKVQTWLARTGLFLFSGLYTLLSVPSWMTLGLKRRFWKKLEAKKGDLTGLEYLKQYVNPKIGKKQLDRAWNATKVDGPLEINANDLNRMPVGLVDKVNNYLNPIFKRLRLVGDSHKEFREFLITKMVRSFLTRVHKREAKLARIIGSNAVEELQASVTPLKVGLNDLKLEALVQSGSKKVTMMHVVIIIACLAGIIACVASNLSTGGLGGDVMGGVAGAATLLVLSRYLYKARSKVQWKALATIVTVAAILASLVALEMVHGVGAIGKFGDGLTALTSLTMLFIDGYFLKQAMKAHSPDKKMRMMLLAISAMTVLIGIMAMTVAKSQDAMIMAGVATAVWLGTGVGSYYYWKKRAEKNREIIQLKQNPFPQHLPAAV